MSRIRSTTTLLDLRIAHGVKGVRGMQIKVVKGIHADKTVDYGFFVDDKPLGGYDAPSDYDGVIIGLEKMKEFLIMLHQQPENSEG